MLLDTVPFYSAFKPARDQSLIN